MNQTAKTGVSAYLMKHMRDYGLLFALIAIMVFFQIVTDGTLLLALAQESADAA